MTTLELIAAGQRMSCQMIHNMCKDLTPEEFEHQPVPGANSAAWIVGHLALTARRFAERVGATGVPQVSEDFVARFKQTRQVAGEQQNLGSREELLKLLDDMTERFVEGLRKLPPEALDGPPPTPGPAVVTSFGEMLLFSSLHIMVHCGQLSTIRRSLGKPPLV